MSGVRKDDSLVRPSFFKPFLKNVAGRVFLVFNRQHLEKLAEQLNRDISKARQLGPMLYLPGKNKKEPGIAGPVVGSPAAVLAAELLIALGCREIIAFGTCGSIHGHMRIGQIVVPSGAVSDEGTSGNYFPGEKRFGTDLVLSNEVRRAAVSCGLEAGEAVAWTTDAFFRETPEKVEMFRKEGCRLVDMELSALAAVSRYRGASVAALWVVSDELFSGKWKPGFFHPRFKKNLKSGMEALLKLF